MANRQHYVQSAKAVSSTFSDSGLFGVQLTANSDSCGKAVENAITELKSMSKITPSELNAAKGFLLNSVLTAMDRTEERLEEAAKNVDLSYLAQRVRQSHALGIRRSD